HAPRPPTPAHQLTALDRHHAALVIPERLLSGEQARGRDELEAGVVELEQRRLVALVGDDRAGPHREEIARRGPLLALLGGAAGAAAEHRPLRPGARAVVL